MSRRPTIIDVARVAGVSKSTVSLVLQNSPSVRDATRDQVRQAMADLGYVYNRSAANMRKSNAGLIGLVINDLRNPFFTEFATSLQMALADKGYATVIANTDENAALQEQVISSMIEHGVSAFIICPTFGDVAATFDAIAKAEIPTMQLLRQIDARVETFPFIAPDYVTGSRLASEHLLAQGAKRIAFVGGLAERSVTEERKQGYLAVLKERGIEPLVLAGRPNRAFGRLAAQELAARPDIDAALCFNDQIALGLLHARHEMGKSVGQDFLLMGFDDIEEAAESYPSLSSVRCDIAQIGSDTASKVVAWLEEGQKPAPTTRTPVTLALRGSTQGQAH